MQEIYNGIILKSVPYKESDAIITLLTKNEGLVSFKARGVHKINSKNSSITQLYTIGEYKLDGKTDYSNKTLISGTSNFFPLKIYNDLMYSCLLSFISEIALIYKDEYKEVYDLLETTIKNLDNIDILTMSLMVLKYILKWNGILFEVDKCVKCESKSIEVFNYDAGGFLCKKCMKGTQFSIDNINYLKQIRIVMKANIENIYSYKIDEVLGDKILIDLFKYIENNLGTYYKTKDMLLMVLNNTDNRLTR